MTIPKLLVCELLAVTVVLAQVSDKHTDLFRGLETMTTIPLTEAS
jgi:hypothetical protein